MLPPKDNLPTIIYRIFGKGEPKDLGPLEYYKWKDRVLVLTTTDYPKEKIEEIKKMGFEVAPPICDSLTAGENSSVLLNYGLEYAKKNGANYALLLASGFQEKIGWIDNISKNIMMEHPNLDVYFYLSEDVNDFKKVKLDPDDMFNLYENRENFIPSESLAMVKIDSIFPLNENLTRKGALGFSSEKIPLGGIELPITIMELFSEGKTLKMCGVITTLDRKPQRFIELYGPGSTMKEYAPVEYTATEFKIKRRNETIDKAMEKMGISRNDYPLIFKDTILVNEFDFVHKPSPD